MESNQGEIEKLYQWACDNYTKELESKYFTKIDKDCESYFEKKTNSLEYGKEYCFQTMPELRSKLDEMWENDDVMQQIKKVVLVASLKNKPKISESGKKYKEENMKQLKQFIYNF